MPIFPPVSEILCEWFFGQKTIHTKFLTQALTGGLA
jgi:hypothetical protein